MAITEAILITGAGKRVGRIFSEYLARPGRVMVLHYNRSEAEAEDLRVNLDARGCSAVTVQADLSDPDSGPKLISSAQDRAGRPLTALINNASIFEYDTAVAPNADIFSRAQQVNLQTPMQLAKGFYAACDETHDNVIINILDQKLWNMNADFFSYTTSKAGLYAATQMMDQAFRPKVRACAIAPGLLLPAQDQSQDHFETVASRNPLQRPIDPVDMARAAEFIIDTPNFHGPVLHIDNGQRFYKSERDTFFVEP